MDITDLVEVPSAKNALEVIVKDDTHFSVPGRGPEGKILRQWIPHGAGGNNRKGLFQSVSLRGRPPVQISDVRIQTSVRRKELSVTYELFNCGKQTIRAQLQAAVHPVDGGATVVNLPITPVELPGLVTTTVTVAAPFENVTLWQPDHPALYSLHTTLGDADGQPFHRVSTRFGFREVWFEGIHFFLNGIRCNLRGESPCCYLELQKLPGPPVAAAAEMIRRYQKVNFNVLRFHAVPAPSYVLDLCDEKGMLAIVESGIYASWGMLAPEHPQWMEACRRHFRDLVRRDRNHPAVVLWSAENEGLNCSGLSPAMLAEFRRAIDAHDGSRPVIFSGDGSGYGASVASVKHYVKTIEDLKERGGNGSGYGRDLRSDIYWAAAYRQDVPLGCGEFLFPAQHQSGPRA